MTKTTFKGPGALAAFMNPDNHVPPLVELPHSLNPYHVHKVRIFIKLMAFLPLANVKSLAAYSMLEKAHVTGELNGVHTLIESSSGNTVFSAGVVARSVYGIDKTIALASDEVESGKLRLLRLFGTEIDVIEEDICPDPEDPASGINQAKARGESPGFFNPGQYDNEANPNAHLRWTGPQIWDQTEGKMTIFCGGLGTTGTLVGTSQYLKKKSPNVFSIGVVRVSNNPVPGVRTEGLLREIAFPWRNSVDSVQQVGTTDAYHASMRLCNLGLMAGPSSGFAYAGLLAQLDQEMQKGTLNDRRNNDDEVVAVFIAPDGPFPYLEEYEKYLDETLFPPLRNAHLLNHDTGHRVSALPNRDEVQNAEVDAGQCMQFVYGTTPETLWAQVEEGKAEESLLLPNVCIIDIRSAHEFTDHHLPGSFRVDYQVFSDHLESVFIPKLLGEKRVLFVCSAGIQSTSLALKARSAGLATAESLKGGTAEWTRRDLPRIRPMNCRSRY